MDKFEIEVWSQDFKTVAGIDEVGRGSLAGPVVAAAVVFEPWCKPIQGVDDSKKLSPKTREILFGEIYKHARAVGIGWVYQKEIDRINILQATFKAMNNAVKDLGIEPDFLLVDGNKAPVSKYQAKTITKGDSKSFSIAAASIIAKVSRDRMMEDLDPSYPEYCFKSNKGYASQAHINAIKENGLTEEHRKTFCHKIMEPQLRIFG
ncbi:MAG: ribonuclease HII [bacterium]|nr:ribonuclease HII [bacterium]